MSYTWSVCTPVSHRSHGKEAGQVLVLGQGDVGQLGLGEDIIERKKPALLSLPEKVVQVIAGGMHTVCLSDTGHVSEHLHAHKICGTGEVVEILVYIVFVCINCYIFKCI